jgi:hypothetical protein
MHDPNMRGYFAMVKVFMFLVTITTIMVVICHRLGVHHH